MKPKAMSSKSSTTEASPKLRDTSSFSVEAARFDDIGALVELLGASVPHVSPDTVWHVPWTWQHYRLVRDAQGQIIGAGSLQPLQDGRAEIRGVVVDRSWRSTRIATMIIESLVGWAQERGIDAVCVTRKPGFFRQFGFQETLPSWLDLHRRPVELDASAESQGAYASKPRVAMTLGYGAASC